MASDGYVDHEEASGQPPGKDGVRFFVKAKRSAFPDISRPGQRLGAVALWTTPTIAPAGGRRPRPPCVAGWYGDCSGFTGSAAEAPTAAPAILTLTDSGNIFCLNEAFPPDSTGISTVFAVLRAGSFCMAGVAGTGSARTKVNGLGDPNRSLATRSRNV